MLFDCSYTAIIVIVALRCFNLETARRRVISSSVRLKGHSLASKERTLTRQQLTNPVDLRLPTRRTYRRPSNVQLR